MTRCVECGRNVSTAATACPGCGHPNPAVSPGKSEPKCHACNARATIRCFGCGALSCVEHVQLVAIRYGREPRCAKCIAKFAAEMKRLKWGLLVVLAILLIAIVVMLKF